MKRVSPRGGVGLEKIEVCVVGDAAAGLVSAVVGRFDLNWEFVEGLNRGDGGGDSSGRDAVVRQLEEAPVPGRGGCRFDGLDVGKGEIDDGNRGPGGGGDVEGGRRVVEESRDCLDSVVEEAFYSEF